MQITAHGASRDATAAGPRQAAGGHDVAGPLQRANSAAAPGAGTGALMLRAATIESRAPHASVVPQAAGHGGATPIHPALPAATAARQHGAGARGQAPHDVLVRHALEISRLTVSHLAAELGIPRSTLEAYRLGTRRMPPAARATLAAFLAHRADALCELAAALIGTPGGGVPEPAQPSTPSRAPVLARVGPS